MFLGSFCEYVGYLIKPILFTLSLIRSMVVAAAISDCDIPPPNDPILHCSATLLAQKIRLKKLTSEDVISAFVERCRLVNGRLNAIIDERFEEALRDARQIDAALRKDEDNISALQKTKPLLGLPITVKENCKVKSMKFTNCVPQFENRRAVRHGMAVRLLVEAGAIPIAVTSTSPFCLYPETNNKLIGVTKNPYDPCKSIGGSSGGEAALLTSAASVIGLATDAGGSITIPCSFTSLYGHRSALESLAIVETEMEHTNEEVPPYTTVVGPMCRYVEDIELMLNVLCRNNLSDLILQVNVSHLTVYYTEQLHPRASFFVDEAVNEKVRLAIRYLNDVHHCRVQRELLSDKAVLLLPSYPRSAFYVNTFLFESSTFFYAAFPTFFDLSSTTIPAGFDDRCRLPLGLQIIANTGQDQLCIAVAKKLNRLFGGWQPPPFTECANRSRNH